jgi:hypothetical protein
MVTAATAGGNLHDQRKLRSDAQASAAPTSNPNPSAACQRREESMEARPR